MGRLSKSDINTLAEFYKERNNLFHGFSYESTHPMTISEAERDRLIGLAGRAYQIVSNRSFGVWSDPKTGDLGNERMDRPDRPRGAVFADEERRKIILRETSEEMEPSGDDS